MFLYPCSSILSTSAGFADRELLALKKATEDPKARTPSNAANLPSSAPAATYSIRTGTAPTPTIHTLYHLPTSSFFPFLTTTTTVPLTPLQRRLGHPTDTGTAEVGLLGLDALDTAQLLVALLLPLGDQRRVGVVVLEQVVVQRLRDGGARVVQVVDVA